MITSIDHSKFISNTGSENVVDARNTSVVITNCEFVDNTLTYSLENIVTYSAVIY